MRYIAKYPTAVHSFILSLMLIQGTYQMLQAHYGRGVVQLSIGMIILFSYFIRYEIKLDETTVHYEILFLGHTFYSKKIVASDIRKIVFKRVGWSARGAFIYTDKLFPIRLINFKPDNMYNQLHLFGKKNGVSIVCREDIMKHSQTVTKES